MLLQLVILATGYRLLILQLVGRDSITIPVATVCGLGDGGGVRKLLELLQRYVATTGPLRCCCVASANERRCRASVLRAYDR